MNKNLEYLETRACSKLSLPLTVLKPPLFTGLGVDRGVILCSPGMIDFLLTRHSVGQLKERWLVVDSMQGYGFGESPVADLHLIASACLLNAYLASPCATTAYSTLGDGGDFVNPQVFYPMAGEPIYDVVFIASWAPLKRHKLLMEAARALKENGSPISILLMGSYCVPGHVSSLVEATEYEASIRQLVVDYGLGVNILPNGDVSHTNADGSSVLGQYTKTEVNELINQARIGVLTSLFEGTTRFVAECLSANRPVVILEALQGGTTKYIDGNTGMRSDNTPEGLAQTILSMLSNLDRFQPRQAFLSSFGYYNSNRELERAIRQVVDSQNDATFTMPNCRFGGDMWSHDYYDLYLSNMD